MSEEGGDVAVAAAPCLGPIPGVAYPITVTYCGQCSMPFEYCEYSGQAEKCKKWAEANAPDVLEKLSLDEPAAEEEDKKHQKRGGKGPKPAGDKKKKDVAQRVTVQRAPRGKKSVTVVKGLATFDIDLKVAAKFFSSKFASSSSVTGADEIVIQGDVRDNLFDVIPQKWKQVDEDAIEDLGDQKR